MKSINVYFENKEFKELSSSKGKHKSWRRFIWQLYQKSKKGYGKIKVLQYSKNKKRTGGKK